MALQILHLRKAYSGLKDTMSPIYKGLSRREHHGTAVQRTVTALRHLLKGRTSRVVDFAYALLVTEYVRFYLAHAVVREMLMLASRCWGRRTPRTRAWTA